MSILRHINTFGGLDQEEIQNKYRVKITRVAKLLGLTRSLFQVFEILWNGNK